MLEPDFVRQFVRSADTSQIIPSPEKHIYLSLFFTIFITVTGMGIVVPLLPVYANSLGASGIYVGLIFGSFSFSRIVLLPFFGRLSDQKGRKPFIVIGLIGNTLVGLALMLSSSVNSLIIIRFFQGIASAMIMPVVQAYVGEITYKHKEGYSMGLFNLSMFASLSIGPLIGGVISDNWSLNSAFAWMAVLSLVGVILSIFLLPPVSREFIKHKDTPPISWKLFIKDKEICSLFFYRFVYTACIGIIWCFLPLFAENKFSLSSTSTGFLIMLGVFISGLLQLPMGYVADRANKTFMVIAGGMICSIAMFILYISDSYLQLIIGVSIFGIGGGISMPAIMTLAVIKGDEKKAMASVMAIITTAHSVGMMIGSMAAGLAMDYLKLEFVFPFGAALMAMGIITFYLFSFSSSVKTNSKKVDIR